MWKRPWGFKEGLCIGGGLFVAGMLLQLFAGGIDQYILAFPVNLILVASFILLLVSAHLFRDRVRFFRWLGSSESAFASIVWTLLLTVLMGLTRQTDSFGFRAEFPGFTQMTSNWAFILEYLWFATSLGLAILRNLKLSRLPFILTHFGLFLILVSFSWMPAIYAGIAMMFAGALWTAIKIIAKKTWLLIACSSILAIVAVIFEIVIHNKPKNPALDSGWYAPHVIAYIFAYTLLGAAFLYAIYLLCFRRKHRLPQATAAVNQISASEMAICDDLVGIGTAFLTIGMMLGAVWAQQAWGAYWSWDPKETWAAATLLSYLGYLHYRIIPPKAGESQAAPDAEAQQKRFRTALCIVLISFILLQICWYGINWLPSAQGVSVHIYNVK